MITAGSNDSSAAYFQITGITGGTLYQNNGTTPITSGSFITLAQGEAGLKFTPTAGSLVNGGFSVQESATAAASGLNGPTTKVAIDVTVQPNEIVNLSNYYNLTGIVNDGSKFSGGLDGAGNAITESEVGTSQTWNGVNFAIGTANTNNVVQAAGQTITLPAASFSKLELLADHREWQPAGSNVHGAITPTVRRRRLRKASAIGTRRKAMPAKPWSRRRSYRDTHQGGRDNKGPFDVYGYAFTWMVPRQSRASRFRATVTSKFWRSRWWPSRPLRPWKRPTSLCLPR